MKKRIIITTFLLMFLAIPVYADVTDRELSILASLVYEDVPNKVEEKTESNSKIKTFFNNLFNNNREIIGNHICDYTKNTGYLGYKTNNASENNCYFRSDGTMLKYGYRVPQYIEGLSQRKKGLMTFVTSSPVEEGPYYYFLNGVNENEYQNWKIDNYYESKHALNSYEDAAESFDSTMSVITFKRGNEYVIAYRGTDFPDVLEWITDIHYIVGKNSQTEPAYQYAISEYERIINNDSSARIYITGHSLGAYLAQIAAAAVSRYETTVDGGIHKNLVKTVYFNGMGIDVLGITKNSYAIDLRYKQNNVPSYLQKFYASNGNSLNFTLKELGKDLMNLSIDNDCITGKKLSWSEKICSSGRLVLYRTEGDPISSIGFHYGDIYQIEGSADAIVNHAFVHGNISPSAHQGLQKIFNNQSVDTKTYLDSGAYTENTFKQLSAQSTMNEISNDTVNNLNNIPDEALALINADFLLANNGVFKLINRGILTPINKYQESGIISGVIGAINVAHETDSLTCLINDNKGIPDSVDIKVKSLSSIGLIDKDVEPVMEDGIKHYYVKNGFYVYALANNGCANNYIWNIQRNSETQTSNLLYATNKFLQDEKMSADYYLNVDAFYGNNITEVKIGKDLLMYKYYETNKQNINSGSLSSEKIIITVDNKAPNCTSLPDNMSVMRNETKTFAFSFDENVNLRKIDISDVIDIFPDIYFDYSAYCNEKTCYVKVTGKKATFASLLKKSKTKTLKLKVQDKLGHVRTVSTKITWTKEKE